MQESEKYKSKFGFNILEHRGLLVVACYHIKWVVSALDPNHQ